LIDSIAARAAASGNAKIISISHFHWAQAGFSEQGIAREKGRLLKNNCCNLSEVSSQQRHG
jgi:hypothetical protein